MKLSDEKLQSHIDARSDYKDGVSYEVCRALTELQLRRQLEEYCIQTHPVTCDYYQNPFSAVCTCGLAKLLAKLKELEGV